MCSTIRRSRKCTYPSERLSDTIVFADEQEHFLYSKRFAAAVLKSDCYFVFITRDDLHTLPYSVNEIYCLKNSGYYQNTRQVYNSASDLSGIFHEETLQKILNSPSEYIESGNFSSRKYSSHDFLKNLRKIQFMLIRKNILIQITLPEEILKN